MSEGEIDIIAAQQNVFTHRQAFELKLAGLRGNGNEGEVGGAAADIDDEDQIAFVYAFAPVFMAFEPCVEGRLRLFQHGDVAIARGFGRSSGEFAGDGVE